MPRPAGLCFSDGGPCQLQPVVELNRADAVAEAKSSSVGGSESVTALWLAEVGVICEQLAARRGRRLSLTRLGRWHERVMDAVPGPVGVTVFVSANGNTGRGNFSLRRSRCAAGLSRGLTPVVKSPVVEEQLPCLSWRAHCPAGGFAAGFVQQAF